MKGLPVLGNLLDLQNRRLELVDEVRDRYGDVARVLFGPTPATFIYEPAGIERVLVDNSANYTKRTRGYDVLRLSFGNGLVTSEGAFWRRQRRIAQPAFHREKIARFAELFAKRAAQRVESWRARAAGAPVDLNAELNTLTMGIAGETLFSVDVSAASDKAGAAIAELLSQALIRTGAFLNFPQWLPTPLNVRHRRASAVLDEVVFGVIRERRAGGPGDDVLSLLMSAVDEETGERMDDAQLRDEVVTMFSAGHETTATMLAWTMHLLLDAPDVDNALRDEIKRAAPAGTIGLAQVSAMPLLDAVIKESLRLYPPIWLIVRRCEADDVVAGHRVHKDDFVFTPPWAVHRHPKLWPDPLRFDPRRFLDVDAERARHRFAYFPFLGGPRKCIGDQFALLEGKVLLATFLRSARFTRASPSTSVKPDPTITLRMKGGLPVHIAVD